MNTLINLFLSSILSGTITGKVEIESFCYTRQGKAVTDCRIDSYFFELQDAKGVRGFQRVAASVFDRQKVGDWFGCNASVCLDMPKAVVK